MAAFGSTCKAGLHPADDEQVQLLIHANTPVVTIFGKTWDLHFTEVLRTSLEENLRIIRETVRFLKAHDRQVFYDAEHFFDGWKANPAFATQTLQAAAEGGAQMVILCDTNGGTLPEEIAQYVREALAVLTPWNVQVGIHCHNDCDLAVANSLAAVDAGAVQVQGTMNGFGERCGNADLISLIANLALKKRGYQVLGGRDLQHLTELSRFVYELANMKRRSNQPFVGQSAFAHKGGMHVHAIEKAPATYEHVNPSLVGNERRILISELSGRSNIRAMTGRQQVPEDAKLTEAILDQVVKLENQGYQFEAAEASFDLLVQRCAGTYHAHFDRIKYHVDVETDEQGEVVTEATVKIRVGGEIRHEVAEGDGPVNALDAALRKALHAHFPTLQ
ncbi:MAG: citramalate synthase, partial [Planctomycetota bacterium]